MKKCIQPTIIGACLISLLGIPTASHATDRHEILEKFSNGDFEIPSVPSSHQRIVVQFGDPFFDGSDVLENLAAFTQVQDTPIIVVTSLWKPQQKATLLHHISSLLNRDKDVYICAGSGEYTDDGRDFDALYTAWPKTSFGDSTTVNPVLSEGTSDTYKGVYNEQMTSYKNVFGDVFNESHFPRQDAVSFIKNVVERYRDNYLLEINVTGPTTDAAKVLKDDDLSSHVRVIRGVMGGGFGKFGSESRLGYNFVIDPHGTKKFIDRIRTLRIPTLVVTSQTCSTMPIKKEDFSQFMESKSKTPLGEAIAQGWKNWNRHMSLKR